MVPAGGTSMNVLKLITTLLLLSYTGTASAQGWFEYENLEDLFSVNFPAEPEISESAYISEYGSPFVARKYSATDGLTEYFVTIVNMENSARPPGRRGTEWRGSIGFHATKIRQTGEVTFDAYGEINVVPGHQLQITQPDGRRNFANIHFHGRRLYVIEAVSPPDLPPPALFQASFAVVDSEGNSLRYNDSDYSFPDRVPLARRGGVTLPGQQ
jgi:hypothetical protein